MDSPDIWTPPFLLPDPVALHSAAKDGRQAGLESTFAERGGPSAR